MSGNERKSTLKHNNASVKRVFDHFATISDAFFFSPGVKYVKSGRVVLICCDSVQETSLTLLSLILVLVLIFRSPKGGAAAATMDYMPPQYPTLPAESTDIFSLSDQVLSDRLEFIEEAGSITFRRHEYSLTFILIDWLWKLG